MIGRPTKCTPEVIEKVCEALSLGVSWAAAAAHAHLHESTVMDWLKWAREGDGSGPYSDFAEATTRARDSAEVRMAAVVLKSAREGNANAAQWWLERRRPKTWGRNDRVEVTGASGGPVAVVATAVTLEQLAAMGAVDLARHLTAALADCGSCEAESSGPKLDP